MRITKFLCLVLLATFHFSCASYPINAIRVSKEECVGDKRCSWNEDKHLCECVAGGVGGYKSWINGSDGP